MTLPQHFGPDIVRDAFKPEGPVIDGPRGYGRRSYDKAFWWVRVIKEVGFPIVAAWWVATRLLPTIEALSVEVVHLRGAVDRDSKVTLAMICKLDPAGCIGHLKENP